MAQHHREAVVHEYQRRLVKMQAQDVAREKLVEDTRRRHIERAIKQEAERIQVLRGKVETQVIAKQIQVDDPTAASVADVTVGDKEKHLYTIGGLLGEVILTLGQAHEALTLANPDFKLTPEMMEPLIRALADAFLKSDATIDIPFAKDHNFAELLEEAHAAQLDAALSPDGIVGPGLKYILEKLAKVGLKAELVRLLLVSLLKFKSKKPVDALPLLAEVTEDRLKEMKEEDKEAEKQQIARENEEIKKQNEEIRKRNEDIAADNARLAQLQAKIQLLCRPELPGLGQTCALVLVGQQEGPTTPRGAGSHRPEDSSLDPSKRNQRSQPALLAPKHLTVANIVDDLRVFIFHRGTVPRSL